MQQAVGEYECRNFGELTVARQKIVAVFNVAIYSVSAERQVDDEEQEEVDQRNDEEHVNTARTALREKTHQLARLREFRLTRIRPHLVAHCQCGKR